MLTTKQQKKLSKLVIDGNLAIIKEFIENIEIDKKYNRYKDNEYACEYFIKKYNIKCLFCNNELKDINYSKINELCTRCLDSEYYSFCHHEPKLIQFFCSNKCYKNTVKVYENLQKNNYELYEECLTTTDYSIATDIIKKYYF
jgi:hypothetical protein